MCRGGRLWGAGKGGVKRLVADTLAVKGLLVAAHAVQGIGAEGGGGGRRDSCGVWGWRDGVWTVGKGGELGEGSATVGGRGRTLWEQNRDITGISHPPLP